MSLDILPNELIECIAIDLNYIDLCHLLQVNSRLNSCISHNNGLWKQSLRKQWPTLYKDVFEPIENKSEINWRSETIQCHLICVKIFEELSQMSVKYHQKVELDETCFDSFRGLATDSRHSCVLDELEHIVNSDNRNKYNLTVKYYAEKVLRSLRTESVGNKWAEMVQELNYRPNGRAGLEHQPVNIFLPDKYDIPGDLIRGSVLIAQYCQPNKTISETKIRQQIRAIAQVTVKILHERNPKNNFITQRHGKLLTESEASTLVKSILEPRDCVEVVHALNVAMYGGTSRFRGNRSEYYLATNSYIDKVLELKVGIPILLCVLYQATAALLGVKLFPIGHPGHFLLAIWDKPKSPEVHQQFTYIDPFNEGELSDQPTISLHPNPPTFFPDGRPIPCRPLAVFHRMALNLIDVARRTSQVEIFVRPFAELVNLTYGMDEQLQFMLARVYLALDINYDKILQISQQLEDQVQARNFLTVAVNKRMATVKPTITVKYRSNVPHLQFAVGMVVRDIRNKNEFICVICGWAESNMERSGALAQFEAILGANNRRDMKQPSYEVLLTDGTTRYIAQEHLSIECEPNANVSEMFPSDIGRYFTGFNGRNYVLNEEIRKLYPDDENALDEIYLNRSKSLE